MSAVQRRVFREHVSRPVAGTRVEQTLWAQHLPNVLTVVAILLLQLSARALARLTPVSEVLGRSCEGKVRVAEVFQIPPFHVNRPIQAGCLCATETPLEAHLAVQVVHVDLRRAMEAFGGFSVVESLIE